ncbi:MAG: hypothetical protein U0835_07770 [Isosphaeraceae bacterium]
MLRYYRRRVRLHWVPVLGVGLSVVAVARQPVDLGFSAGGVTTFLTRLAMASGERFRPGVRDGLALDLTVVMLTPEPIGPGTTPCFSPWSTAARSDACARCPSG